MPTIAIDLQKRFKLIVIDGLPQATVEIAGETHWVKCCPLCGCAHQLLGVDENLPYAPLCQTVPVLYKAQQEKWHKLYPGVAQYTELHLVPEVIKRR